MKEKYVGLAETLEKINEWVNNDDMYAEIFYDYSDNTVWCRMHCDFTHNTFTRYKSDDIIKCAVVRRRVSLEYLQSLVDDAIAESDYILSQTGMR